MCCTVALCCRIHIGHVRWNHKTNAVMCLDSISISPLVFINLQLFWLWYTLLTSFDIMVTSFSLRTLNGVTCWFGHTLQAIVTLQLWNYDFFAIYNASHDFHFLQKNTVPQLFMPHQPLATGGSLSSGCQWECIRDHSSTKSLLTWYLVRSAANLRLWCSGHKDKLTRFEGEEVESHNGTSSIARETQTAWTACSLRPILTHIFSAIAFCYSGLWEFIVIK